jgi:hypothetical protein
VTVALRLGHLLLVAESRPHPKPPGVEALAPFPPRLI